MRYDSNGLLTIGHTPSTTYTQIHQMNAFAVMSLRQGSGTYDSLYGSTAGGKKNTGITKASASI